MIKQCVGLVCCLLCLFSMVSDVAAREDSLVIWSHWANEPVKINFLNAVAAEFEKAYSIPVDIVWMDKAELLDKLPFALETSEPDISYIDLGFGHPRIARSLADLSKLNIIAPVNPSWQIGNLAQVEQVFLPIEGVSNAIYYNKTLFAQANISLPEDRPLTAEEFLELVNTLRAQDITPIGEGGADRVSKLAIPLMNAIFRYIGPEKMTQLLEGQINFADPEVMKGLTYWKQVLDAQGYEPDQVMKLSMMDGIFEVTDGNAAMTFCGTWIYSKYGTTEHDQGQIGVMDWFTMENGKGNDFYEIAWVAGYGANQNSRHLEKARQFLEFLMTPVAASLWAKHVQSPYPVITEEFPEGALYGKLAQQRSHLQAVTYLYSYPSFKAKAANNMLNELVPKFIQGEISVEEFVQRMNSRM